jgi:hypothetical protein
MMKKLFTIAAFLWACTFPQQAQFDHSPKEETNMAAKESVLVLDDEKAIESIGDKKS